MGFMRLTPRDEKGPKAMSSRAPDEGMDMRKVTQVRNRGSEIGSGRGSVGNETKADVKAAQGSRAGSTASEFAAAKAELRSQHPHHPEMRPMPHHESTAHIRHEHLGGLRPVGKR